MIEFIEKNTNSKLKGALIYFVASRPHTTKHNKFEQRRYQAGLDA